MEARIRMNQHQKTQLNIQRINAYNLYKQRKAAEKVARAAEEQHSYVDPRANLMDKWAHRLEEQELLSQMTEEEVAEYMLERRAIAEQEAWDNSISGRFVDGLKAAGIALAQIFFGFLALVALFALVYAFAA